MKPTNLKKHAANRDIMLNSLFIVRAIRVVGVGTKHASICSWHFCFLNWQPLLFSSKPYISEHKLIWTLEINN